MKDQNPEDHGGYEPPPDAGIPVTPGGGAPSGKCSAEQVAGGYVETQIRDDGTFDPHFLECVLAAEADRRRDINYPTGPMGGNKNNQAAGGPSAPSGPARYNFAPVPEFIPPQFEWNETFKAPSAEEALNDPGYQFRASEGQKALQQSQAAKGILRTGGSLKDLLGWGQNFASQEYGNVFDRYARGYDTRFNTAKDRFQFKYTGAKDAYAPRLFEWQTKSAFGSNAAQRAWERQWEDYWRNTLSASDIYNSGQ